MFMIFLVKMNNYLQTIQDGWKSMGVVWESKFIAKGNFMAGLIMLSFQLIMIHLI